MTSHQTRSPAHPELVEGHTAMAPLFFDKLRMSGDFSFHHQQPSPRE
ncbi:hypothetical protein [Vreelandella massiliensis]|nr:hypothetical protein [Halomonas massiliensis]